MRLRRWSVVIGTLLVAGCGGGGGYTSAPTTYTPPNNPPSGTQTLGSISTNVSSVSLTAGESRTISVSAVDTQGNPIPGIAPTFTSANVAIAEVSSAGVVMAVAAGSTQVNVSVTVGSLTKTATVAVAVSGSLSSTASVTADAGGYSFTPDRVIIAQNGTVTWQFGALEHNVTFLGTAPGTPQSIGNSYGVQVSRTFTAKGNFSYQCSIHAGMNGEVLVR
jgi:plastocyanin